ncbi:hypothetical protein GCM10022215_15190 [Nocardioides fonticola]|uniref:Uncharacterized protein n=1 Tax=Nocardioides fonticola TaxID=450363 RepID=A0ABP7XGF7_9ACTN
MAEMNDTTSDAARRLLAEPRLAGETPPLRASVTADEWGAHTIALPGVGRTHLSRVAEVEHVLDQYRPQIMQGHASGQVVVDFLKGRSVLGDTHEQRFVEGRTWEQHAPFTDEVSKYGESPLEVTSQVVLTRSRRHGEGEAPADQDRATCIWVIRDGDRRVSQRVELRAEELDWLHQLLDRRRDLCDAGGEAREADGDAGADHIGKVIQALSRAWRNHPEVSLGELLDRLRDLYDAQQDDRGRARALSWTSIADDALIALVDDLDRAEP